MKTVQILMYSALFVVIAFVALVPAAAADDVTVALVPAAAADDVTVALVPEAVSDDVACGAADGTCIQSNSFIQRKHSVATVSGDASRSNASWGVFGTIVENIFDPPPLDACIDYMVMESYIIMAEGRIDKYDGQRKDLKEEIEQLNEDLDEMSGACQMPTEYSEFVMATYTKLESTYCKGNNLEMSHHESQCYKNQGKNGYKSGDTPSSNALCLTAFECESLCTATPECGAIEMDKDEDRCYLNERVCIDSTNQDTSPRYDLFTRVYTRLEKTSCPGNNVLMRRHADQCYKHKGREGWSESFSGTSNALCLNEAECLSLCSQTSECKGVEMHRTLERCYLNVESCMSSFAHDESSSYDLLIQGAHKTDGPCRPAPKAQLKHGGMKCAEPGEHFTNLDLLECLSENCPSGRVEWWPDGSCTCCQTEEFVVPEYTIIESTYCEGMNVDMSDHESQCYKLPEHEGYSSTYTAGSNAICLEATECMRLCSETSDCVAVETHRSKPRCYLSTADCKKEGSQTSSSNYDLRIPDVPHPENAEDNQGGIYSTWPSKVEAVSLDTCLELCTEDPACSSAGYNPDLQDCRLNHGPCDVKASDYVDEVGTGWRNFNVIKDIETRVKGNGKCEESSMDTSEVGSQAECHDRCSDDDGCEYYAYKEEDDGKFSCVLFSKDGTCHLDEDGENSDWQTSIIYRKCDGDQVEAVQEIKHNIQKKTAEMGELKVIIEELKEDIDEWSEEQADNECSKVVDAVNKIKEGLNNLLCGLASALLDVVGVCIDKLLLSIPGVGQMLLPMQMQPHCLPGTKFLGKALRFGHEVMSVIMFLYDLMMDAINSIPGAGDLFQVLGTILDNIDFMLSLSCGQIGTAVIIIAKPFIMCNLPWKLDGGKCWEDDDCLVLGRSLAQLSVGGGSTYPMLPDA